ncbi:MAG: 50S ribosomal protein L15 [Proteobacteria bacterium]|nr:50S ribosomal protein L15 [Pseudomonadota bacterium]
MRLNEIPRPAGKQAKRTKRVGRGTGSGWGGTAGRGHKGQKARAGSGGKMGFEGGQMPLSRRLPKRGFTNIFRTEYAVVNLDKLAGIAPGTEVTLEALIESGLVRKGMDGLKVLGRGEITSALTVKAAAFSDSARKKIEAAGGKAEVVRG